MGLKIVELADLVGDLKNDKITMTRAEAWDLLGEIDDLAKKVSDLSRSPTQKIEIPRETTHTLDAARDCVLTSRTGYGTPQQNFDCIAGLWVNYLDNRGELGLQINAQDVAQMLILLKASRQRNQHNPDNLIDQAGYAQCAAWCDSK